MSSEFVFTFLAAILVFLIAVPVLTLSALARLRRLEKRESAGTDPRVLARLYGLEQRLDEIERKLAAAPAPAPAATQVQAETQPARPAPAPEPSVSTPPQKSSAQPPNVVRAPAPVARAARPALELETLIAGRWLNRVGLIALLFAVAFFLKYAFDNNWVGQRGRVAIGLLAGCGLLVYGEWLLRRGYRYFSEGISGLGAAVLYLSLYAGWSYYHLFSQGVAFVGMVVVTAAMVVVAVGRDSQRIALLALMGGFLTPMLVSTGKDQQIVLFTYLCVLDGSLLALARARDWRSLELVSFVWTQIFFWAWYDRFYSDSVVVRTTAFVTLFFVLFALLPVIRSRRTGKLTKDQILLVLSNAFSFLVALRAMLWADHRWALTITVLALAALHVVMARVVPRPRPEEPPLPRLLFAGLALMFVTLVIPIRLEGKWITMAWAVEGAVLVWSGARARIAFLRGTGLVLFALVATRLWLFRMSAERFLLNPRFAVFAVTLICYALALYFVRRELAVRKPGERNAFAILGVAANVFALWALSLELWDLFGRMRPQIGLDKNLARQTSLSLFWTLYATILMIFGVRHRMAPLRWQALALFGLTAAKVFLYDLASLERIYRILSFLVIGVVLLAVSFLYERSRVGRRSEEKS